jgi:hypothetical protein
MDLNFKRRTREIAIAKEIALASFSAVSKANDQVVIDARDRLIEYIDRVLKHHEIDDKAAQHRIVLAYLPKELDRMNRDVTSANSQVISVIGRLERAAS